MASSHPLDQELDRLVKHFQIRTIPPLEAEVLQQHPDGSLELRLVMSEERAKLWGLESGLDFVPLALQGCWQVRIAPGARVKLEFMASDPATRYVTQVLSGTILEATVDAATIKIGPTAGSVELGKGLKPVASLGDQTDPAAPGKPSTLTTVINTVVKV